MLIRDAKWPTIVPTSRALLFSGTNGALSRSLQLNESFVCPSCIQACIRYNGEYRDDMTVVVFRRLTRQLMYV